MRAKYMHTHMPTTFLLCLRVCVYTVKFEVRFGLAHLTVIPRVQNHAVLMIIMRVFLYLFDSFLRRTTEYFTYATAAVHGGKDHESLLLFGCLTVTGKMSRHVGEPQLVLLFISLKCLHLTRTP